MRKRGQEITGRLASGPSRGLGCAEAIAVDALESPETLKELVAAVSDARPLVTLRAANALKKVQPQRPELLVPYASRLLRVAARCEDLRTRWNLMIVIGELPLRGRDKALALELLFEALGSESGFLRAFALTGLANLAREDTTIRRRVAPLVQKALEDTSAAVRARARKVTKTLRGVER